MDVVKKAAKEDGDKKRKTHENCQRTPMEIYIDDAEKKVEQGKAKQEELKEKYLNLLKYFGEDEELKSGQFFSTINTFVKEFGVEQDKHKRQEEAKVRQFWSMYLQFLSQNNIFKPSCVQNVTYYCSFTKMKG